MAEESFDASIFPDFITPLRAACVLVELYGAGAADAASSSAAAALADNRFKDYRFWMTVRQAVAPDCPTTADPAPAFPGRLPEPDFVPAGDDDDTELSTLPPVNELLRLIRQFARIPNRDTRDFAIERMKAIAEHRVVPLRRKRT